MFCARFNLWTFICSMVLLWRRSIRPHAQERKIGTYIKHKRGTIFQEDLNAKRNIQKTLNVWALKMRHEAAIGVGFVWGGRPKKDLHFTRWQMIDHVEWNMTVYQRGRLISTRSCWTCFSFAPNFTTELIPRLPRVPPRAFITLPISDDCCTAFIAQSFCLALGYADFDRDWWIYHC